jgi:ribonucleotide monophosphatase NagD (HAD superfamily)
MDPDFNYAKMKDAVNVAIDAKTIIACNNEKVFRCSDNFLCPGCGAMVSSISFCSSRTPDIFIGKPNPYMIEYVLSKYNLSSNETLIVGDTYESDIAMANKIGSNSVLVNSKSGIDIKDLPKTIMNYV